MSSLTKVFVGMLVVLSLLLAAASVTFLNTIPNYGTRIAELDASLKAAESRVNSARSEFTAKETAQTEQLASLNNELSRLQSQVSSLQTQLGTAEADKAAAQVRLASAQSTAAIASQALAANNSVLEQFQQQIATLRDENLTRVGESTQLQARLAQVENELTFAERALRAAQEESAQAARNQSDYESLIRELGGDDALARLGSVAPEINAVIVERTNIGGGNGRPYATISVGREDDVRPGNQFAVFDQGSNGNFLGFIRIEEVDDGQAFGLLQGPNIGQIDAGDVVRKG